MTLQKLSPFLLGFFFSLSAHALQPLSDFLEIAEEQAPEMVLQEFRQIRDEQTVRENFYRFFPTLTTRLSYQRLIDGTVGLFPAQNENSILPSQNGGGQVVLSGNNLPLNQWGLSAQVEVPIINPRAWLDYAKAKGALSITESQALETKLEISERISELYFQLLAVSAETQIARLQDQLNRSLLLQLEARTEIGDADINELDEFVSQIELAEARRLNAEETLQATADHLYRLTHLEPNLSRIEAPEWSFESEPPLNEWLTLSNRHPALQSGEQRVESARTAANLTRFEWLPELNGTIGYQGSTLYTPGFAAGITLSMRFDASRIPRRSSLIAEAHAQEIELLVLKDRIEEEVRAAHLRVHQLIRTGRAIKTEGLSLARRLQRNRRAVLAGNMQISALVPSLQANFNNKLLEIQNRVELAYARIMLRLTVGLSYPSRSPL